MTERMPDFAMPSADDLERDRARAADEEREAATRAALGSDREGRGAADADAGRAPSSGAGIAGAEPSPGPGRRRRRVLALARNPFVAFAAGAVLVAAAFVAVPAIQRQADAGTRAQLDRLVAAYVGAIEAGDLAAATAMAPVDDAAADDALLDAAIPTTSPTFDCAEPSVDDDVATVSCQPALPPYADGAPMRIRLVRDGEWRIETGLAVASPLFLPLVRVLSVGTADLPDGVRLGADPVWLYPGEYALDLETSPRLEIAGAEAVAVVADGIFWVGGATAGAEMRQELTQAALDYVSACADEGGAGCPDVAPLAPGERFEAVADGSTSTNGQELLLGVLVRRIGGAPDQWGIDVRAQFAEDLQSYVVAPAVPSI